MLLTLQVTASLIAPVAAQQNAQTVPYVGPMMDVPDYSFEHEETGIRSWRVDGDRAGGTELAYLILDSQGGSSPRRALIVVDGKNPEEAFFLEGNRLQRVPAEKGKLLGDRIDRRLTYRAGLVTPDWSSHDWTLTVSGPLDGLGKEPVKIGFEKALSNFTTRYADIPCLALPDTLTLLRGGRRSEFVILLKREKTEENFIQRGCADFTPALSSPMFSYVEAAGLHFAFTKTRFVIQHRNYIVSIPYDLDDEAIRRSPLLVTKGQLDKILSDVGDYFDRHAEAERSVAAVQRSIDVALLALLKAKGEK